MWLSFVSWALLEIADLSTPYKPIPEHQTWRVIYPYVPLIQTGIKIAQRMGWEKDGDEIFDALAMFGGHPHGPALYGLIGEVSRTKWYRLIFAGEKQNEGIVMLFYEKENLVFYMQYLGQKEGQILGVRAIRTRK